MVKRIPWVILVLALAACTRRLPVRVQPTAQIPTVQAPELPEIPEMIKPTPALRLQAGQVPLFFPVAPVRQEGGPRQVGQHQGPPFYLFAPLIRKAIQPAPLPPTPVLPAADTNQPSIEIEVSNTNLVVGEQVNLVGRPVGVASPVYQLYAKDPGMLDGALLASVDSENEALMLIGSTGIIGYQDAYGDPTQVIFTLRATDPGQTEVWVSVTGELLYGDPGSIDWAGESSNRVLITVNP